MATTTYTDMAAASTLHDDDVFAVDQHPGDESKKVSLSQVAGYIESEVVTPAVAAETTRAQGAEEDLAEDVEELDEEKANIVSVPQIKTLAEAVVSDVLGTVTFDTASTPVVSGLAGNIVFSDGSRIDVNSTGEMIYTSAASVVTDIYTGGAWQVPSLDTGTVAIASTSDTAGGAWEKGTWNAGDEKIDLVDVKQAVDNLAAEKLDRRVSGAEVYSHDGAGQNGIAYSTNPVGGTIVQRWPTGQVRGAAPSDDSDLTPKAYVDTAIEAEADRVDTALDAKENLSNKATSLSSSSDNTQYPSAKATYDFVQLALESYTGSLKIPTSIALESSINPDVSGFDNGTYWVCEEMDVTAPGHSGRVWVNTIPYYSSVCTLESGGTGYEVGDILRYGNLALEVLTVDGSGVIQTFTLNTAESYTDLSGTAVAFTGGSGTGAAFDIVSTQEAPAKFFFRVVDQFHSPDGTSIIINGLGQFAVSEEWLNNLYVRNDVVNTSGNVRATYEYPTEAAYEADKDNVPDGARVVIMDRYPDNHIMAEQPDYDSMGTTNLISTNNGTWTANQRGYVVLQFRAYTSLSSQVLSASINDKVCFRTQANMNTGTNVLNRLYGILQVSVGDVVKMWCSDTATFSDCSCYFCPSRFTPVMQPKIVAGIDSDYSLTEQPVMIWDPFTATVRQKKDIDGRGIWERSLDITVGAPSVSGLMNRWAYDTGIPITRVVAANGDFWVDVPSMQTSGQRHPVNAFTATYSSTKAYIITKVFRVDGKLNISVEGSTTDAAQTWTTGDIKATVQYTKP